MYMSMFISSRLDFIVPFYVIRIYKSFMTHYILNFVRLCGNKETRDVLRDTKIGKIVSPIISNLIDSSSSSSKPSEKTKSSNSFNSKDKTRLGSIKSQSGFLEMETQTLFDYPQHHSMLFRQTGESHLTWQI